LLAFTRDFENSPKQFFAWELPNYTIGIRKMLETGLINLKGVIVEHVAYIRESGYTLGERYLI